MADVRVKDLASTAATIADTDYVVVDSTADGTRKALATVVKTYMQTGVLASTTTRTANTVYAGPTTGADAAATFRALVAADIPDISATYSTAASVSSAITTALADYTPTASLGDLATLDTVADAQVAAGAAIALSKLATVTASRALVSTAGGVVSASAVTATELGYLSGVTSAVQTQLAAKEPALGNPASDGYVLSSTAAGVRSWVEASGGGGYAKLTESGTNDGTLTLYDDTASTGVSQLVVRGGAGQSTTPLVLVEDSGGNDWVRMGDLGSIVGVDMAYGGLIIARTSTTAGTGPAGYSLRAGDGLWLRSANGVKWLDGADAISGSFVLGLAMDAAGVLRVSDGSTGTGGIGLSDAVTAAVSDALKLRHESSGTPAAGFGTGLCFQGESSTTSNQDMARIASVWSTATHASRSADLAFSTVASAGSLTERLRLKSDGRLMVTTPNAAPTDADIAASQVTLYLDETANKLHFRVKYADGTTLKTGEVALV
jgi:hypothetical protein